MTHPIAELRADLLGRIERSAAEAQREHQGNEPWTWTNWTPKPPWASFIALCDPTTIARMARIVRAADLVIQEDYETPDRGPSIFAVRKLREARAALSAFDDLEAERAKEADRG